MLPLHGRRPGADASSKPNYLPHSQRVGSGTRSERRIGPRFARILQTLRVHQSHLQPFRQNVSCRSSLCLNFKMRATKRIVLFSFCTFLHNFVRFPPPLLLTSHSTGSHPWPFSFSTSSIHGLTSLAFNVLLQKTSSHALSRFTPTLLATLLAVWNISLASNTMPHPRAISKGLAGPSPGLPKT